MSELICDVCGSEIPERSKFCGQCGDPVTDADRPDGGSADSETVQLVCGKCKKQDIYEISADGSAILRCSSCKDEFRVQVVEIRSKRSRGSKKDNTRHYTIRAKLFSGREELIEFSDGSYTDFEMKSKDLVAFVYRKGDLSIVQNLTLGRYMTVSRGCFIATAVYGPYADETQILRAFRDARLRRSRVGLEFIRFYYWSSPILARRLRRPSVAQAAVRSLLDRVVAVVKLWVE